MSKKNSGAHNHRGVGAIRIIGGLWRGRKIAVSSLPGLRPTPDRVRETLFNWLMPYLPGSRCLDLFGGTGALSIEALSRGAASATLLENSPDAIQAIKKVMVSFEIINMDIIHADALMWLKRNTPHPADIVFIDPPFHQHLVTPCCALLEERGWLSADAWIYIEHERGIMVEVPTTWHCHRQQTAGDVSYSLYQRKT